MIDFFDNYTGKGLKPIACYKNSKTPVGFEWEKDWTVERWRPYFFSDEYNMGILLGEIIDVEGDCEESCNLLESMIGDTKRPKFKSSKSVHNLFLNPDPDLTRVVFKGIEFRGHKHQSVVPPSFHEDGSKYSFLNDSCWPIPPMPTKLKEFYLQHRQKNFKIPSKIREGVRKTVCKYCDKSYFIHTKRLILEVRAFREQNLLWMCHKCRPFDIKDACRRLRKSIIEIF